MQRIDILYILSLSMARLLYDGTNLWKGGEVKGKQDRGVSESVM
jgi:hypothetical protein